MSLTFNQGIHPDYNKEITRDKNLIEIKKPGKVIIPLQQHIGAPCEPLVEKGDSVKSGEKIGESDSFVSAPVHASVSGVVEEIKKVLVPGGKKVSSIIIKTDSENNEKKKIDNLEKVNDITSDQIISLVKEAGITGMGGAMFPTHVKISIPDDKNIDYFILNGAECEPYLTGDHRLMLEKHQEIISGMKYLMRAVDANQGIIAIEDNKPEAIDLMKKALAQENNIEVKIFDTKYPQGGEKMLIKAALDREVPVGGLPLDIGVVVNNVGTALKVNQAVEKRIPFIKRTVTVTGSGIKKPGNFIVPIGTPFKDVVEAAGGFKGDPGKVIAGGPMMGVAQSNLEVPVVKGTSGILVFTEEEAEEVSPLSCINCARCVDSCPMGLVPTRLVDYVKNEMFEKADDYQIDNCCECGSCAYVCPSNIPLVHYLRIGKAELAARKRDNNE